MRKALILILLTGLLLLATTSTDAQSDPPPDAGCTADGVDDPRLDSCEPAPVMQSSEDALAQDLGLVAEAKGWTVDEAEANHKAADAVGRIAVRIAAERPEIFVGSVVSQDPYEAPSLYIKGPADPFVRSLVASSEIVVRIVDRQPYSFDELEERKLRVHRALEELGFRQVSAGFDIRAGGQIAATVGKQVSLPEEPAGILSLLPASLRDGVSLTVSDAPVLVEFSAFGGMWVRDNGVDWCTSGWSVLNGFGTTGVTTAGHCGNGVDQINDPVTGLTGLAFQAGHFGQWGDVEWLTSVQLEPAQFYATNLDIRYVTEVEPIAGISQGENICMYGRGSNARNCSRNVEDVSKSCMGLNRLVQMNGSAGTFGDSGGGWSLNNRAYGSVVGLCDAKAVFSVADYYDDAIGVTVRRYVGSETAGVFRTTGSAGEWHLNNQHGGGSVTSFSYGLTTDTPVTGDWDGDGDETIGIFRSSNVQWHLKNTNSAGAANHVFSFGLGTDKPVVGDWDGNGSDTAGVWRASDWYLNNCHCGATPSPFTYGNPGDIPIVGDWDGDGDATVGVYRPSTQQFFLNNQNDSSAPEHNFSYGNSGDTPIAGDWDGDGVDTVGVWRGACWYLRNIHAGGTADISYCFGNGSDKPVTGDWDGS